LWKFQKLFDVNIPKKVGVHLEHGIKIGGNDLDDNCDIQLVSQSKDYGIYYSESVAMLDFM